MLGGAVGSGGRFAPAVGASVLVVLAVADGGSVRVAATSGACVGSVAAVASAPCPARSED